MVKKLDLRPSLPRLIGGLQRQATQGIARPMSRLVVQEPHEAPDGESVIPSVDVLQSLSEVDAAVEAAGQELEDAKAAYDLAFADHASAIQTAEGAIGALELATEPETMAAAVGVFIDAMMQHLTVTGVANLKQLVADELFAKLAVVDKLQALSEIITRDMIATGAITSEKVAANAITAAMLDVGENLRFTSNGIEIFAPVDGDQDWQDWDNRAKIVTLTPHGDVAVSVAQGGQTTAGMRPDGHVWGDHGDFNRLSVGGQPIESLVADKPIGVVSTSALPDTVTLSGAETRLLTLPVRMFPGRMYRVTAQVSVLSTEGVALRVRQSKNSVPTTANTMQFHQTYVGAGDRILKFDYLLTPDTVPTEIPEDGEERNVGIFVYSPTGQSVQVRGAVVAGVPRTFVVAEDIGPAVDIAWQQPAETVVPKQTFSKAVSYSWWRGFSASGAHSVDDAATVGGNIWGSAMHERILVGVGNLTSTLSGADVTKATVTVRRADSRGYSSAAWNVGFVQAASAPGTLPTITNIATNVTFGFGQAKTISVPTAHLDKLRTGAFSAIALTPTHPGTTGSYGLVDVRATRINVTYRK